MLTKFQVFYILSNNKYNKFDFGASNFLAASQQIAANEKCVVDQLLWG